MELEKVTPLCPCVASQVHLPFAVVGSTEEVKIGNKMAKARQYPWGVVQGTCTVRGRERSRSTPAPAAPVPSLPAVFGKVLSRGQEEGSSRAVHVAVVKRGSKTR